MEKLFETNVVKSNFFYFATENFQAYKELTNKLLEIEEFKKYANNILKSEEKNPLFCLAKRWTKILAEDIIKPDIIIFEGGEAEKYFLSSIKNDDCGFKIKFNPKYITLTRNRSNIPYEEKIEKCKELKKLLNKL